MTKSQNAAFMRENGLISKLPFITNKCQNINVMDFSYQVYNLNKYRCVLRIIYCIGSDMLRCYIIPTVH